MAVSKERGVEGVACSRLTTTNTLLGSIQHKLDHSAKHGEGVALLLYKEAKGDW